MPLFDYDCPACGEHFEALVRGATTPACPKCGNLAPVKAISRIAPAGKIEAIRMSNRRAAAAEGHFNHYSPSDQARLLKGKRV